MNILSPIKSLFSVFSVVKKLSTLILLFGFISSYSFAQGQIWGTVRDIETSEPIPFATVFLSNTTIGAVTDLEGNFSINLPNGEYELIVTYLGYETIRQIINTRRISGLQLSVLIRRTDIQLQEKVVEDTRDPSWFENLKIFKEYFLGTSINAKKAKILNTEALILDDESKPGFLLAKAREPILIENANLGYLIKFVLVSFEYNFEEQKWSYFGYPYFENIEVSPRQQNKIAKNRERAFFGSIAHFFQSVYRGELGTEGFEVVYIERVKGSEQDKSFKNIRKTAKAEDMVAKGENGEVFFNFAKDIFIYYRYEPEEFAYSRRLKKQRNLYQTSLLSLLEDQIRIEPNGMYSPASGVYTEGYMAWERVADLLPFDYIPEMYTSFTEESPEN